MIKFQMIPKNSWIVRCVSLIVWLGVVSWVYLIVWVFILNQFKCEQDFEYFTNEI
jgi:hypothetical protein